MLRIVKSLDLHAYYGSSRDTQCSTDLATSGSEDDDSDSERLNKNAGDGQEGPKVIYDIAYSTSYQCPALYLQFAGIHGTDAIERVVPTVSKAQLDAIGVVGGISLTVWYPEGTEPLLSATLNCTGSSTHGDSGVLRPSLQDHRSHSHNIREYGIGTLAVSDDMDWRDRQRSRAEHTDGYSASCTDGREAA